METYLGNKELLDKRKIGFFALRKIPTSAILPTHDRAMEISKRTDVAVVSRSFTLALHRKEIHESTK